MSSTTQVSAQTETDAFRMLTSFDALLENQTEEIINAEQSDLILRSHVAAVAAAFMDSKNQIGSLTMTAERWATIGNQQNVETAEITATSQLRQQERDMLLAENRRLRTAAVDEIVALKQKIKEGKELNTSMSEGRLGDVNAALAEAAQERQAYMAEMEAWKAAVAKQHAEIEDTLAGAIAEIDGVVAENDALRKDSEIVKLSRKARMGALQQELAVKSAEYEAHVAENTALAQEGDRKYAAMEQNVQEVFTAHNQEHQKWKALEVSVEAENARIGAEYKKTEDYYNSVVDKYNKLVVEYQVAYKQYNDLVKTLETEEANHQIALLAALLSKTLREVRAQIEPRDLLASGSWRKTA